MSADVDLLEHFRKTWAIAEMQRLRGYLAIKRRRADLQADGRHSARLSRALALLAVAAERAEK